MSVGSYRRALNLGCAQDPLPLEPSVAEFPVLLIDPHGSRLRTDPKLSNTIFVRIRANDVSLRAATQDIVALIVDNVLVDKICVLKRFHREWGSFSKLV